MKKPETLPAHLHEIWDQVAPTVRPNIGPVGLEALCTQVHRLRDAQQRVEKDGAVVADAKGNPCPHPAIVIERQAQAEIREWVRRFGAR